MRNNRDRLRITAIAGALPVSRKKPCWLRKRKLNLKKNILFKHVNKLLNKIS